MKKRKSKARVKTAAAEQKYGTSLRGVARHIGHIISGFAPNNYPLDDVSTIQHLLALYSDVLRPWAGAVSKAMIDDVNRRDLATWHTLTRGIGAQLRHDLRHTSVGHTMRGLMQEQVDLITSLPTKAAARVHKLALIGLESSSRGSEIKEMIMASGHVSAAHATLIARTETSRTASALNRTRSMQAGLTHYRWRTSDDGDVRPGHRAMEGQICEWANPPAVVENDKIMHFHPGEIWNCRCYAETILPED